MKGHNLKKLLTTEENKYYSGHTPEDAHAILSFLENNVISIQFDDGEEPFNPGEEGTTIGDAVWRMLCNRAGIEPGNEDVIPDTTPGMGY